MKCPKLLLLLLLWKTHSGAVFFDRLPELKPRAQNTTARSSKPSLPKRCSIHHNKYYMSRVVWPGDNLQVTNSWLLRNFIQQHWPLIFVWVFIFQKDEAFLWPPPHPPPPSPHHIFPSFPRWRPLIRGHSSRTYLSYWSLFPLLYFSICSFHSSSCFLSSALWCFLVWHLILTVSYESRILYLCQQSSWLNLTALESKGFL